MAEPITPPAAQLPPPNTPTCLAACSPGMISEKALAASITPAPKPNSVSCSRSGSRCENSTGSVPSAVASAATEPPTKALHTSGSARTNCQNCDATTSTPAATMARPIHSRAGRAGFAAACGHGGLQWVVHGRAPQPPSTAVAAWRRATSAQFTTL
jgi:hypothetical protein